MTPGFDEGFGGIGGGDTKPVWPLGWAVRKGLSSGVERGNIVEVPVLLLLICIERLLAPTWARAGVAVVADGSIWSKVRTGEDCAGGLTEDGIFKLTCRLGGGCRGSAGMFCAFCDVPP